LEKKKKKGELHLAMFGEYRRGAKGKEEKGGKRTPPGI